MFQTAVTVPPECQILISLNPETVQILHMDRMNSVKFLLYCTIILAMFLQNEVPGLECGQCNKLYFKEVTTDVIHTITSKSTICRQKNTFLNDLAFARPYNQKIGFQP